MTSLRIPSAASPAAAAVILALGVAGCGGSDDDAATPAAATPAGAAAAQTTYPASTPKGQVASVAMRYIKAIVAGDYGAACATRTQGEQRTIARKGGSCGDALGAAFDPQTTDVFRNLRIGTVQISGTRAQATLVAPGVNKAALTLSAVREGDRWALVGDSGGAG